MENTIYAISRTLLAQGYDNAVSETKPKYQATTIGLITAYASIIIMSIVPIVFGSLQSARNQKSSKEAGEVSETMSTKDAMMFPLIASAALFGLYLVFNILGTEHVNMLLTFYFFLIGVLACTHVLPPFLRFLVRGWSFIRNDEYYIHMERRTNVDEDGSPMSVLFELTFDHFDIIALIMSCFLGVWYLMKKHWIANNLFGLAFAHNAIEYLQLNSVGTGCILLGGLFVYDVFWVFGTDVMVTVAKSFEAPIKLVFPQDFLEVGVWGQHHAMLGLGDIVIPGIFIALLLRFDISKSISNDSHRSSSGRRESGSGFGFRKYLYFWVSFLAYIAGLMLTVFVMTVYKHAQPALLYLVPLCVGSPLFIALCMGDLSQMFQYRDNPEDDSNDSLEGATGEKSGSASGKDAENAGASELQHTDSKPSKNTGANGVSTRLRAKKAN